MLKECMLAIGKLIVLQLGIGHLEIAQTIHDNKLNLTSSSDYYKMTSHEYYKFPYSRSVGFLAHDVSRGRISPNGVNTTFRVLSRSHSQLGSRLPHALG